MFIAYQSKFGIGIEQCVLLIRFVRPCSTENIESKLYCKLFRGDLYPIYNYLSNIITIVIRVSNSTSFTFLAETNSV